jgi:hypothetical protein
MEKLNKIEHTLICSVEEYMSNGLQKINTAELGEVIDMIKDLEEAIYYHHKSDIIEHNEMKKQDED